MYTYFHKIVIFVYITIYLIKNAGIGLRFFTEELKFAQNI